MASPFSAIARGSPEAMNTFVQSVLKSLSTDELRQLIRRHEHKYYVENQPELLDDDFDHPMTALVEIEAKSIEPPPL